MVAGSGDLHLLPCHPRTHADWLGTERARSDSDGNLCFSTKSLPFGDHSVSAGTCDVSPNHFTGKPRDAETGFDYFGARFYSSVMGRFISADWGTVPVAVPYATFENPQSLNLYAYVLSNPVTAVDLDGHNCASGIGCTSNPSAFARPGFEGECAGQKLCEKLPKDPSGLNKNRWKEEGKKAKAHKNPKQGARRFVDPEGNALDFEPGTQGAEGFRGSDHWHWNPYDPRKRK